MKKRILFCLVIFLFESVFARAEYNDHRNRNLDSLERVVAGVTPEQVAAMDDEHCTATVSAYAELMWGYAQINSERSLFFARKTLAVGTQRDWLYRMFDGNRMIGQYYYGVGQCDSAMYYYLQALKVIDRMPGRYDEEVVDDARSQMFGTIGNLYNVMDSIPKAMEYYALAEDIFEKQGWKESSSVLYHNMGETWMEEGNLAEAERCFSQALDFGNESADSLQIAEALSGLGAVYLQKGKTNKALHYLQQADEYYIHHEDQEFGHRIEALDLIGKVLKAQKRQLWVMVAGGFAIILLLIGFIVILLHSRRLRKEKEAADEVIDQALEVETPHVVLENENDLTQREKEILPLLAAGLTSPQIADKLYLSIPTIKWYRRRLLERFNAKNTTEMIMKAREKSFL